MMNRSCTWLAACLLALCLWNSASPASGADGAADRKKELQRIKREMEEKKRKIRKADKRERSVLGEIEKIEKAIQARDAELSREQQRLREAEATLTDVEKSTAVVERDLFQLKASYRDRVRALYKMGRSGYAVGIFSSESMTAAVKRVKYLEIVAGRDRSVIANYRKALDSLSRQQKEVAGRKEEISRRRQDIRSRQDGLTAERKKNSTLLASVRKEKELSEQVLEELEESSKDLWALIKREEEAKRKTARAVPARPGAGAPAAALSGRGKLPWPVNGKVVTPYGRQRHPQFGTVVFRRGIDIEVREGEPVRAVSAGRTAFADWYKGYGKLLILEHDTGFYSLYGYLSRLDIKKGDPVAAGQVIGLAGDTGGIKGSKLYFEIRRHGEAEDPLAWLAPRQTVLR
jgi:septal ring factor EnvC (AmiA/AmiB activator)